MTQPIATTVHVMAPPDKAMRDADESLCTDERETEVVFHPSCTEYADGWVCLHCGTCSASKREPTQ